MNRAEIWTVAGEPDYAGKPRPAVILQDDAFEGTVSITSIGLFWCSSAWPDVCSRSARSRGVKIARCFLSAGRTTSSWVDGAAVSPRFWCSLPP